MTFSKLPLHYIHAYSNESDARAVVAQIRATNPHEVARVFPRNVRAGGASVRVWVVVIRGKVEGK